tara:strand:- start:218 stop:403 length:186 start_codon:yes stop_codon:yes gene_type:complete
MGRLDEDGNLTFINRYDNLCKCMGFNVAGDTVIWHEASFLHRNAGDDDSTERWIFLCTIVF